MKSRQAIWAANEKFRLRVILGGRCARCGLQHCLTFDCIKPTGDKHHRMGSTARVAFYKAQMAKGNLQLLCSACNSAKGASPQPRYVPHPAQSLLPVIRSDFDTLTVDTVR